MNFSQIPWQWNDAHSYLLSPCSPLPILSLSGVDRHDCLSPCFSVLCELWVELVLSQIAPHSVHPPQYGPSSRSLASHLHCCYLLCNVRVFSPHHMAIPRKVFLGDICGDWLDHCIAPELFISDSVFPCFALIITLLSYYHLIMTYFSIRSIPKWCVLHQNPTSNNQCLDCMLRTLMNEWIFIQHCQVQSHQKHNFVHDKSQWSNIVLLELRIAQMIKTMLKGNAGSLNKTYEVAFPSRLHTINCYNYIHCYMILFRHHSPCIRQIENHRQKIPNNRFRKNDKTRDGFGVLRIQDMNVVTVTPLSANLLGNIPINPIAIVLLSLSW